MKLFFQNEINHIGVFKKKPLHIEVYINGNNTIAVKNNLQLRKSVDNSTKVGLNNIIKRYWLFSGQEVAVNNDAESFSVALPLLTLN